MWAISRVSSTARCQVTGVSLHDCALSLHTAVSSSSPVSSHLTKVFCKFSLVWFLYKCWNTKECLIAKPQKSRAWGRAYHVSRDQCGHKGVYGWCTSHTTYRDVPESVAPSLGFFPGPGTSSEPDLHNGTGSLPSVRKVALCQTQRVWFHLFNI